MVGLILVSVSFLCFSPLLCFFVFFFSVLFVLSPFVLSPFSVAFSGFYKAREWPFFTCSCLTIMRHERLCFFEKKQGQKRGRKFALSCLVRFPVLFLFSSLFFFLLFFFHPPVPLARSLILSGFIARECQAFETVFKPLLQKRFLGKKAKKAMNNLLKTTPFVWWE